MAEASEIEWTDATWNPITGCTMVSAGCTNCYAMGLAGTRLKNHPSRVGLTRETGGRHVWTGEVRLNEGWLDQPLRWKRSRMIFVCAHGDLFHESVPDEWIDRIFAVMALAPQHTFQVLTKRPERMRGYLAASRSSVICREAFDLVCEDHIANPKSRLGDQCIMTGDIPHLRDWPLPNVWIGTSIEDQATAAARIPHLLATPAAVRFVSAEPLLGPVQVEEWLHDSHCWEFPGICICSDPREVSIDWVICGGESGPGARPMHPDWARSLRDQCQAAGVAFFFKQWGEWGPCELASAGSTAVKAVDFSGRVLAGVEAIDGGTAPVELMSRLGKKVAGRLLDGREWNQMPGVRA
jgi:protein gp37